MLSRLILSSGFIFMGTAACFAQGFSGAELGIEYTDSSAIEEFGGVNYYGSAEFELAYGFSAAFSASSYNFDVGTTDVSNLTAHLIYNVDAATALGLFIGQDYVDDDSSDIFGAELAYDFGLGGIEVYVGSSSDAANNDFTIYGAATTYEMGSGFGLVANLDGLSGDDFSSSALEIGGFFQLAQGPRFGATLGQLSFDTGGVDESETYFGIQASIGVGPNGGTTFGSRDGFEAVRFASPF